MAIEDTFPFAQTAQVPAPRPFVEPGPPPAATTAPQTPQQAGMAAVAAPQRSVAELAASQIPGGLLGRIGFVLSSVAAGMQGQELPAQRLARQALQAEGIERQQITSGIAAIGQGLGLLQNVAPDQRDAFVRQFGQIGDRIAPGFSALFASVATQPDSQELARAFGEFADILTPFVRGMAPAQAWETARRLISDRGFMDHIERTRDAENRPRVAARLQAMQAAIQSGTSAGLLPPEAGERARGIDPAVMADVIIGRESGGRADARSPTSTATGLGQFTDGTWLGTREAPGIAARAGVPADLLQRAWAGDAEARQQVLAARTDPQIARRGVLAFMGQNATALANAGVEVNPTNLYLMGFGEGNALPMIREARANPDKPIDQVVRADAYAANQTLFARGGRPRTVGEVVQEISGDVTTRYGRAVAQGGRGMTMTQFEALNSAAPEPFRLTPGEVGTLRRNPDLMLSANIVPPALQAHMAQARATQQVQQEGERPQLQEMVENGQRFFLAINPRTGEVVHRIPAGEIQGSSEFERLARIPRDQRTPEQQGRLQRLVAGDHGITITGPNGETIQIGGSATRDGQTPTQAGQNVQMVRRQAVAASPALELMADVRQRLASGRGATGLVGAVVGFLEGARGQAEQAIGSLNLQPGERSLLNPQNYADMLPSLPSGVAADTAALQADLVNLAFLVARSREPTGVLTEGDVRRSMTTLGINGWFTSREQAQAGIARAEADIRRRYRAAHQQFLREEPLPPWANEPETAPRGGSAAPTQGGSAGLSIGGRPISALTTAEELDAAQRTPNLTPEQSDALRARIRQRLEEVRRENARRQGAQ